MPIKQKILRSSVAGDRPVGFEEGESYVNYADLQFGVVDTGGAAQDLVAVRFFSTTAVYVLNDVVVNTADNIMYQCIVASTGPGVFNAPDWQVFGGGGSTPGGPEGAVQYNVGGVFTGVAGFQFDGSILEVPRAIVGDSGTEDGGIDINGTIYDSNLKASVINSTDIAQFVMHRHSTTWPPAMVTARTMTNDATHLPVALDDHLFRLLSVGWGGTFYSPATEIRAVVDGAVSATSMPGRLEFHTTRPGTILPTLSAVIDSNGDMQLLGNLELNDTDPTIDLITGAGTASLRLAGGGADPGIGSFDLSHDGVNATIQAQGNANVLRVGTNGGSYMLMYDNGHLGQPGNFSWLTTDDEDVIFWDESTGELQIISGIFGNKALAATFNAAHDLVLTNDLQLNSTIGFATVGTARLEFSTVSEAFVTAARNGATNLHYNNLIKASTVSNGLSVTDTLSIANTSGSGLLFTGAANADIRHNQSAFTIRILTENSAGAQRVCAQFGGATPQAILSYDSGERFRTDSAGAYASGRFAINPFGLTDDVVFEFWQAGSPVADITFEDLGDLWRFNNPNAGSIVFDVNSVSALSLTSGLVNALVPLQTTASVAGGSGFNIPEGVAPTTPVDGDHWVTVAGEYFVRLNGVSVDLAGGGGTPGGATTQIQFNNAGSFDGDPELTYTGGGTFFPTLKLGDGVARFPVLNIEYPANGDGSIEFTELGAARGGLSYYPSLGGFTDVLRLENKVNGGGATNSVTEITAENLVRFRADEDGVTFQTGIRLFETTAKSYADDLAYGQIYVDSTSGLPIFVDGAGTEYAMTGGSGGIGGTIADNQIAVGAAIAGDIEGSTGLTFDSATNELEIGENGRFNLGNGNERIMWANAGNGSITIYQNSQPTIDISGTNDITMQWGNLTVGSTSATNGVVSIRSSGTTSQILDFYLGTTKQSEIRMNATTNDLEIRTQVAGREVAVFSDLGFEAMRWKGTNGDTEMGGYLTLYNGATPTDGQVLTWVTANGRAEFVTGGSGGIGGSIADNQVAVGAATANNIEGSASLTWDGTTLLANRVGVPAGQFIFLDGGGNTYLTESSADTMALVTGGFARITAAAATVRLLPNQLQIGGTNGDVSVFLEAATTDDSSIRFRRNGVEEGRIFMSYASDEMSFSYGGGTPLTLDSDGAFFGDRISEREVTVGAGTALDMTAGTYFVKTISANTTFTFTNPDTRTDGVTSFTLELTNPGAFTITWPTSVEWPGGTEPTWTVTGVDIVSFVTKDSGTTWRGFLGGQAFA